MLSIHMAYWIQCIYNLDTIFTGDVADSGPDTELPATLCPATRNVSFNYDACLFEFPLQSLLIQVGFFCARIDYHLMFGAPALKKGSIPAIARVPCHLWFRGFVFGLLFLVPEWFTTKGSSGQVTVLLGLRFC